MSADLWLVSFQDLAKETSTHFILAHEMKQPKSRSVGQGAEK